MKKMITFAAALVALCGCSNKTPETQSSAEAATAAQAPAAASEQAPSCTPTCKDSMDNTAWADAGNAFGLSMLAALPADKSIVYSPYSVERAMGMAVEGACGATADEMKSALQMPANACFSQAGASVEKEILGAKTEGLMIAVDNRLWADEAFKMREDYVARVKASYSAPPMQVNFHGDPQGAAKIINDHIAKATADRIQNILPPNAVSSMTALVLTNAVYFKAPWENKFDPNMTKKEDFRSADGVAQVDMMNRRGKAGYFETDTYQALDMKFAGGEYKLRIILPKVEENGDVMAALAAVEKSLASSALRDMTMDMDNIKVDISVPKFRIEYGTALKSFFEKLGVKHAFNSPDFSAISADSDNLNISEIYHKAFIEIDEEGGEAAAATAVVMNKRSIAPPAKVMTFKADHPFVFAIMHETTGTALFMGRVVKI